MSRGRLVIFLLGVYASSILAMDICEDLADGMRLAHPMSCEKFVVCEQQKTAQILTCPHGLHFNRNLGECDLRRFAGCEVQAPSEAADTDTCECCCPCNCETTPTPTIPTGPTPTPSVPTPTPSVPTPTPSVPTPTPSIPTPTPSVPTPTPSVPTPTPSVPTPTPSVPTPTPSVPTPTPSVPTPTPSIPTPTPSVPTPSVPTPTGAPGSNCGNNITSCVGKPPNTVMYNEGDCNQYIVCVGDCAVLNRCPNNLQYSLTNGYCDYPENVNCPWQSTPPAVGPSGISCAQPGVCASQPDGTMFSNSATNGYIVCQCECEIPMPCPPGLVFNATLQTCGPSATGSGITCPDGLVYNATANACDWPAGTDLGTGNTNVNCSSTSTLCQNQPEGTLFPVDGVCNQFYKCNFGCAVVQYCPNNLVYNSPEEYCDYPQNYKCPWPYTPPSGPSAGPSGIACPSSGRCAGQAEGTFLASSTDCSQYTVCQCECEIQMSCPQGLYFDGVQNVCTFPDSANCSA